MDDNAKVLLETLLAARSDEQQGDPLPEDKLFELFCFEQILKQNEISQEEIALGKLVEETTVESTVSTPSLTASY